MGEQNKFSEEYDELRITAEGVSKLSKENSYMDVLEVPTYKTFPDFKDPTKDVKKVVMKVQLHDGSVGEYVPNKKSASFIANQCGTKFINWFILG